MQLFERLKKALKNPKSIAEGWYNDWVKSPEIERIAKERLKICDKCEYKKPDKIFEGYMCEKCLCVLRKKARSLKENCPIGKWNM